MQPDRKPLDVAASLPDRGHLWCAAAITAAGVLVYLNSFAGVFIYDDLTQIVESHRIRNFGSFWGNRPLVALSLALNYRLGGLEPWGYHLFNLVVHVLAGLALFGVVRRTLSLEQFGEKLRRGGPWYALAVALIWVVHPLQTESVTYVIQRAESMMGLFYLLTIYCLIRGSGASRPWPWYAAGIAVCLLGMASKPVMVTAPLVAILYDRAFLSGSLADALRRRWGLYAGLCGTWLVILATGTLGAIVDVDPVRPTTAGFGYDGASPLAYALTQPGVLVHYVWLAVWPHPLCLDYDWPIARSVVAVAVPGLVVAALLVASLLSFRRRPWLAFLGSSFFVILAPTSSIVPFAHPAFEHRMYVPLAAVIVLFVIGAAAGLERWYGRLAVPPVVAWRVNASVLVAVVALFGMLTVNRNRDYHSADRMWQDVMVQRPLNPRPYNEIANIAAERGETDLAIELYEHAISLNPTDHLAHDNLGNVLLQIGRTTRALEHARTAVMLRPDNHRSQCTLANALIAAGDLEQGLRHLYEAVRLKPRDPWSHSNLGRGLALEAERLAPVAGDEARRKLDEAVGHFVEAIRLEADFPQAANYLAYVLASSGRIDETIARYPEVRLDAAHALAWVLTGEQSYSAGREDDAESSYRRALAIDPANAAARRRLQSLAQSAAASAAD